MKTYGVALCNGRLEGHSQFGRGSGLSFLYLHSEVRGTLKGFEGREQCDGSVPVLETGRAGLNPACHLLVLVSVASNRNMICVLEIEPVAGCFGSSG